MQDVFIAEMLAVERTTSVLHKDRRYRPLCNAQFCVKNSLSWKRRVKILKKLYVDYKKADDVWCRLKVRIALCNGALWSLVMNLSFDYFIGIKDLSFLGQISTNPGPQIV